MPLYEYQCESCSQRFEKIQKFSDPPIDICPACGGRVKKLLSSPAIQFKGTGWYITDYAKKSSDAGNAAKSTTPTPSTDSSTSTPAPGPATDSSAKPDSGAKKDSSAKKD